MPERKKTSIKGRKAAKILDDAKPEFYFKLIDGSEIKNLLELADSLHSMSDDSFYYHVNGKRNDFSNWIKDIFKENDLADNVAGLNSRLEAEICILRFLVKNRGNK